MISDNSEYYAMWESKKIELRNNISGLECELLNASILLDRWSKWAKIFGSLIYEQKDFVQLQEDTEKFFNTYNKE